MDIHEYDDRFALFVDLPGVDPNQVEITLTNGVLSLSGEPVLHREVPRFGCDPGRSTARKSTHWVSGQIYM